MSERPRRSSARPSSAGKRIRTDQVRYPGLDSSVLPPDGRPSNGQEPGDPARLRQARDTGFRLDDSRRSRARSKRSRVRRQRVLALAVILAFVAIASVGAASWVGNAIRLGRERATAGTPAVAAARPLPETLRRAETLRAPPTPIFATFRGLQIHLPVSSASLTELGFHQASYAYAFPMRTWLKDADLEKAGKKRGTGRSPETNVGSDGKLAGRVLRLWRTGRPGRPDTAVDVGAIAGNPVYSPVTGTVLKVKPYKLYGTYTDVQVHIGPDGYSTVDAVLIHLDNVTVKAGDRVDAGITVIGHVRRLSNLMTLELGSYTPGPGDHTHLQLNNIKDPSYKGLTDE